MARKRQQQPWQYKFSFALVVVLLFLVLGYFVQSFQAVREIEPVRIAVERIKGADSKSVDPDSSQTSD